MNTKDLKEFQESQWAACPVCGFTDCQQYNKGKNKGLFRCYECNIRFEKSKIINQVR